MKKKIFCFVIILLIVVACVIIYSLKTQEVTIEECMENREWLHKESELREETEHNWEILGTGEIKCSHCEKTYKIGDAFNYVPEINNEKIILNKELTGCDKDQIIKAENTNWVVLGTSTDGKAILITTDEPVSVEYNIKFKGLEAYTYGKSVLNAICREFYSNSEYGFARSIDIEDINKCLEFENPTKQYSYLETVYEDDELKEKEIWGATGEINTILTDIPLYHEVVANGTYSPKGDIGPKSLGDYFLDGYTLQLLERTEKGTYNIETVGLGYTFESEEKKVKLIFGEEENYAYWLATNGTTLSEDCVNFGLGMVKDKKATTWSKMYDSTGKSTEKNSEEEKTGIRPVVEIFKID